MNARECYTYSGTFDTELWYVQLFGKIPNRHEFEVRHSDVDIDFNNLNFDDIKQLFRPPFLVRRYSYTMIDNDPDENTEEFVSSLNEEYGGSISFCADGKCVWIGASKVAIFYDSSESLDDIKELAKKIYDIANKEQPEEKKSKVEFIKCYNGDYYTESYKLPETDLDVNVNYNEDFAPIHEDIVNFLKEDRSGLILAYGDSGTGKTRYIQYLMNCVPKDYILIPISIASQLDTPELMTFVTDHSDSVFILEDCEKLLESREENSWNNAISTILNLSDGLMGIATRIKIICTFNAPVSKIDSALLRKGRCIAKYEFKELTAERVAKLNEKYNLGITEIKPMTIAEAFNWNESDYSNKKNVKKIGF